MRGSRPRRVTPISRAIRCARRRNGSRRASRPTSWTNTGDLFRVHDIVAVAPHARRERLFGSADLCSRRMPKATLISLDNHKHTRRKNQLRLKPRGCGKYAAFFRDPGAAVLNHSERHGFQPVKNIGQFPSADKFLYPIDISRVIYCCQSHLESLFRSIR